MGIPLNVLNRLRLGRSVAAEVSASRPGWRAWVIVRPVMKSGRTYDEALKEWNQKGEALRSYDDSVCSFAVRYTELTEWHLAMASEGDLDLAVEEQPIVDESVIC